jgi:aspartyl-tRNA(Asn)/glutamyl-tRNA(Gln) amidotransferase subunit C
VKISAETVAYLADLARLELSAEEAERMRRDLDAILAYVDKLSELDTEGVPPTAHVLDIHTPYREDVVRDVLPVAEAIRNAPEHDDATMIVPKVIE